MHSHIGYIWLTFLIKLFSREQAKSHWLHLFNISTVCFQTSPKLYNHTGYICLTFLHCVFKNQIACLIGYKITLVAFFSSPLCVPKQVLKWRAQEEPSVHHPCQAIGCIRLTFLHCVLSNINSNRTNYLVLQNIVIEYTGSVPSIHPGPTSSTDNSQKNLIVGVGNPDD